MTDVKYDAELCERLERLVHERIARPGCPECGYTRIADDELTDLADQLAAARAEIERLRDELDHATADDGDHLSKASRRMVDTVMGERDALREKLRVLTTQVYLPMDCPVCGRHRMEWNGKVLRCEKCTTSSEFDGFTVDAYRAARDKAGES